MPDILLKTPDYVFSYRVAGICIREGKVLLQRPSDDPGFAFPGGHVAFGETNAQTLIREFREEIGADIAVRGLKWVAEIFFPWGDRPCHQICLYYEITLEDEGQIPLEGRFIGNEHTQGKAIEVEFHWIALDRLDEILLYPVNAKALLKNNPEGVAHFVYQE